jgi:hypothetical protein
LIIAFLSTRKFPSEGIFVHPKNPTDKQEGFFDETVIRVEDPAAIKDISQEVESLFNSKELKSKDIQEWGREIYGE